MAFSRVATRHAKAEGPLKPFPVPDLMPLQVMRRACRFLGKPSSSFPFPEYMSISRRIRETGNGRRETNSA